MYLDQCGTADFGVVSIKCIQVNTDEGELDHYRFEYEGKVQKYSDICLAINEKYPVIASLLIQLGRDKFLNAVLEWDPSKKSVRDEFFNFLYEQLNENNSWDKEDRNY